MQRPGTGGGVDTREKFLLTAERLFGERGINGVSLREISRAVGQRNPSALQYHFGSRDALIEAILAKRMGVLDKQRHAFLEDLARNDDKVDVRDIVRAIKQPLIDLLQAEDGPVQYLHFLVEVYLNDEIDVNELVSDKYDAGLRLGYRLYRAALPDLPEPIARQRYRWLVRSGPFLFADLHGTIKRRRKTGRPFDIERALESTMDMLVGALTAPVSNETKTRLAASTRNEQREEDPNERERDPGEAGRRRTRRGNPRRQHGTAARQPDLQGDS